MRPYHFGLLTLVLLTFSALAIAGSSHPIQATSLATPPATPLISANLPAITPSNASRLAPLAWLSRGDIGQIVWSPDSTTLAVSGADVYWGHKSNTAKTWLYQTKDFQKPPMLIEASPDRGGGNSAFSPDGKVLAFMNVNTLGIELWDAVTRQRLTTLTAYTPDPMAYYAKVAFSPDGKFLLAYDDATVIVWTLATHSPYLVLQDASSFAFSPDGRLLAVSFREGAIVVWNLVTGQNEAVFEWDTYVGNLVFSRDSRWLVFQTSDSALQPNTTIQIWDIASGKPVISWQNTGGAGLFGFTRDNRALIIWNGRLELWLVSSGKTAVIFDEKGYVHIESATLSPDGKLFAIPMTIDDPRRTALVVCDTDSGRIRGRLPMGYFPVFSPDSKRLAFLSHDKSLQLWDSATGSIQTVSDHHSEEVTRLAFSADSKRLAAGGGFGPSDGNPTYGVIRVWEVATGKRQTFIEGYRDNIAGLAFSPDGVVIAAGSYPFNDGKLRLWNAVTGKLLTELDRTTYYTQVAYSPDGKWLAYENYLISSYNALTGNPPIKLVGHSERKEVGPLAFSPDSKVLTTVGADGTVRQWDVATGRHERILGAAGDENCAVFNNDGTLLATRGSTIYSAEVWNVQMDKRLYTVYHPNLEGLCVRAISPDGRLLILTDRCAERGDTFSDKAYILETATGKTLATLKIDSYEQGIFLPLPVLLFSPDGTLLAYASSFGTVQLWGIP